MYNPQIRTFLQAADAGSFSRAAERLYLSPVSVMNQINALEKRIGVRLFERTPHGVTLTAAGRSFYADARQMMAFSDSAIERARRIAGRERLLIRVGTSILHPCQKLMDLWARADHGTLPFQMQVVPFDDDPAGMSAMLQSLGRAIDCFIGPCDSAAWKKNYSLYLTGTCRCCIAVSRRHPLAKKERLTWDDLAGETLMLIKRGESPVLDRLRADIETAHPSVRIADLPAFYDMDVFNACEQRGYLLEVPETWADVHPAIATIPVQWDYEMPFGIVYARQPSQAFAQFIQILSSAS